MLVAAVVLANARTHTAESINRPAWQLPSPNEGLWVMGPGVRQDDVVTTLGRLSDSSLKQQPHHYFARNDDQETCRNIPAAHFARVMPNRRVPLQIEGAGKTPPLDAD